MSATITPDTRAAWGRIAARAATVTRTVLSAAVQQQRYVVTVTLPTDERVEMALSEFAEFIGEFVVEARNDDEVVARQDDILAEINALVLEV